MIALIEHDNSSRLMRGFWMAETFCRTSAIVEDLDRHIAWCPPLGSGKSVQSNNFIFHNSGELSQKVLGGV
jgi:hypothetical protein